MGIGTLRRYHRLKAEAAKKKGEGALAAAFESKRQGDPCTPLAEDFPGREALVAAGLGCEEDLRGADMNELTTIKGIGKKTAEKILAALEG